MNERIRELWEQAGMNIVDDKFSTYGKFAEKFAELIVRECLNICRECIEDGCVEAEEPLWKIKQHFGVEE